MKRINMPKNTYPDFLTHFKRENIESNLKEPEIKGCQENALIESFEKAPQSIGL